MKTTNAYLVQEYNDSEKRLLQLVGAVYSYTLKGWFITEDQLNRMNDPSLLQEPIVDKDLILIDDLIDSWKIYGNTYAKKDTIKQLGARWSPSDKSWRIDKHKADRSELERMLS